MSDIEPRGFNPTLYTQLYEHIESIKESVLVV